MTGKFGGVGQLECVGLQGWRNEQAIRRTCSGTRLILHCRPHSLLNLPGEIGDHAESWEDGSRTWGLNLLLQELMGQGVRFDIARPRLVEEGEIEAG